MSRIAERVLSGRKEEMLGEGIPEENISRAVEEATKTYQVKGSPPDLEAVAKRASEEVSQPPTELSSGPT